MRKRSMVFVVLLSCVLGAGAQEPKTIITGDEMQIQQGGKRVVFSGNSKVTRGESMLNADELVQDKKNDRIEASGNISFRSFTKERELVEGRSAKAFYSPEAGIGELWDNRPEITYHVKNATGPIVVESDRIYFDENNEEISASGAVQILSSSATARASRADLRQKEKIVVLSGAPPQPELIYRGEDQKGKYYADRITLFTERHKVILEGNVNGKVDVKELDRKR